LGLGPFFLLSLIPHFYRQYGKDPAQILIRWSLQHGCVYFAPGYLLSLNDGPSFVPLPKSQNPDRVRSNIDVFDFEISKEDIEKLDELDRGKLGAITWNPINVD
jgi:diketogulonate reductase-like aldo/keto reductase